MAMPISGRKGKCIGELTHLLRMNLDIGNYEDKKVRKKIRH